MNEELAAYITRLCELSGHTTWIKKDLILVEPGEDFIYDAFTMVKEYYAFGYFEGIHSAGQTSDPRPSRFSRSSRSCTSPQTFVQRTSSRFLNPRSTSHQ